MSYLTDVSDLTYVEYSSSDRSSDDTVSGEDSEAGESEKGKSVISNYSSSLRRRQK